MKRLSIHLLHLLLSSSLSSREGVRTLNEAMEMLFISSLFSNDEKLQRTSEFHQIQQNKTAKKVIDFGTLPSSHTDKHSMNPHRKKRRHGGAQKRTEQGRGALITVRGGCIQRLLLCLSDSAKTVLRAFMKRVACIDTCRVHSPVRLHRTHHHHEAKELLLLEAATAIKASKRTIQGREHQQQQSLPKPGFVGLGLGFEAWIRICLQALITQAVSSIVCTLV
jgi:hypothetical protein